MFRYPAMAEGSYRSGPSDPETPKLPNMLTGGFCQCDTVPFINFQMAKTVYTSLQLEVGGTQIVEM